MKKTLYIFLLILAGGCGIFDDDSSNEPLSKLYVTLQGVDQVAVLDAENLEIIKLIDTDFNGSEMDNTPHFVSIDKTNGYWFVTTIMSGYVGMYDLESDALIDTLMLGDSPALMTLDVDNKKLYCSRMMPMAGMMMGTVSQVIQEIDYSTGSLESVTEYQIDSPSPHGISVDAASGYIITASNTADWLYQIDLISGQVTGAALDQNINPSTPGMEVQRLKPIQCTVTSPNRVAVSCSAGKWMNPYTGVETEINGNIQLWDTSTMTLVDSLNFQWSSKPWHSVKSPISNTIFVVLSGDGSVANSSGIASVSINNDELILNWISRDNDFHTLHGIDVSGDGSRLFVSSRLTGEIHMLDANSGTLVSTMQLSDNPDMLLCGGVAAGR